MPTLPLDSDFEFHKRLELTTPSDNHLHTQASAHDWGQTETEARASKRPDKKRKKKGSVRELPQVHRHNAYHCEIRDDPICSKALFNKSKLSTQKEKKKLQ